MFECVGIINERKQAKFFCHFAECNCNSTRQRGHSQDTWKLLYRVPLSRYSAKCMTLPSVKALTLGKHQDFAECQMTGT